MRAPKLHLDPCRPPVWARSGHAQTLLGHLLPSPRWEEAGQAIRIPLPDGDTLTARFHPGTRPGVVCIFHGLGGTIDADYMTRSARVIRERFGFSVLRVNHRGCGEGKGLAKSPYHSGRAEDLSTAILRARELCPGQPVFALGFSLSGAALLLLLTGRRGSEKPDAALAVNAPIQLERSALLLKRGLNRVYDLRFVKLCNSTVPAPPPVRPWATLHDFDQAYTAPQGGFQSREHYYSSCSSGPHLESIQTPTLILTAADDPFIDVQDYRDARLSSTTTLHIERVGGHMGYLSHEKGRWLDYAIGQSFESLAKI